MSLHTTPARDNPKVSVVRMPSALDITVTQGMLPQLAAILEQSAAGVILDLGGMEFMSSGGLRMLLMLRKKAKDIGKPIALIRVQSLVYNVFEVAELDKAFHFFDNQGDAIRALWTLP
jgi:anti-sigma B factor antagonist